MFGISMELLISIFILIITGTTFLWNWIDRRKKKPFVPHMTLQGKNYFNVTMYNNASYNLIIYKAFKGRIWFFRKRMSIDIKDVNNESHSDMLAKQKLGNLDKSSGGNEKHFKMYLELNEDVSEKTFVFKTNAGSCKFVTKKINR